MKRSKILIIIAILLFVVAGAVGATLYLKSTDSTESSESSQQSSETKYYKTQAECEAASGGPCVGPTYCDYKCDEDFFKGAWVPKNSP